MNEQLLTVNELADALRVSTGWIYSRTRQKNSGIPAIRCGKKLRFNLNDIIAWAEGDKRGSESSEDRPTHVYIGRRKCGCCCATYVDMGDRQTGKSVSDFISSGMTVERVSFHEYRNSVSKEKTFMNCTHSESGL